MGDHRPVWADVDLGALRHNVASLSALVSPASTLVVVKAEGYGHGAPPIARAAVEAGATWLGVALVEEGVELRNAGIDAPILVLSEPPPGAAADVVAHGLTPVVYTPGALDSLAGAVADADAEAVPVHLKVDTGMHRVGCTPDEALALVKDIESRDGLVLEGVLTHLAVAEDRNDPYTADQLGRFDDVIGSIRRDGVAVSMVHAANSAAAIGHVASRLDLVRIGIAAYGIAPGPIPDDADVDLVPVLSLHARVSFVKDVPAGTAVSYGLHYTTTSATRLATVPIGYGDGVPRNLGLLGGEVLVRGRRAPIAGAVTMDQLVIDCGSAESDAPIVEVGDEVVLIGRQDGDEITAQAWADLLDTIPYEVVCGIGARVPRRYVG